MIKKNITINFCGRLYAIDEDACELLSHYTDTLRRYFKNEGTEEVADDIESRIAELFDEHLANGTNAINLNMVKTIIGQIGELSELAPDADKQEQANESKASDSKPTTPHKPTKKLYRDLEHKVLCGVCSGLERYLGIGAAWFRVAFVVFTIGFLFFLLLAAGLGFGAPMPLALLAASFRFGFSALPIFIYLLSAFIIPAAVEPEDRLRMMGKEVNPQNLSQEVARKPELGSSSVMAGCFSLVYRFIALIVGIVSMIFFGMCSYVICFGTDHISLFGRRFYFNDDSEALIQQIKDATHQYDDLSNITFLCAFGILAYCCFHAVTRGYGKKRSMSGAQRMGWIFAIVALVSASLWFGHKFDQAEAQVRYEYREAHKHNGYYFSENEWEFFENGHWKLIKAENLTDDRYTYRGEYPDGDPDERYLDAYSYNKNLIYRVERTDSVAAGTYSLYSLARCSDNAKGAFIYVIVEDKDGSESQYLSEIPGYGHRTTSDGIINGWCNINIYNIEVPEGAKVRYGVTTDKAQTGRYCNAEYVSATDFVLKKQ